MRPEGLDHSKQQTQIKERGVHSRNSCTLYPVFAPVLTEKREGETSPGSSEHKNEGWTSPCQVARINERKGARPYHIIHHFAQSRGSGAVLSLRNAKPAPYVLLGNKGTAPSSQQGLDPASHSECYSHVPHLCHPLSLT